MDDAIRTCLDKPECVGFVFGGDANCDVETWREIHFKDKTWGLTFEEPQYIFASTEMQRNPERAKGDVIVGMGIKGLIFEQQESAAGGREKQHDNIVVRWEYLPPAPSKKCKSGAPEHDEFAPESGTKERQRGPKNCLDVRVPKNTEDTEDRVDAIRKKAIRQEPA